MIGRIRLAPLAAAAFALLFSGSGCALFDHRSPATIENGTVANPRVGWHGYRLVLPPGFEALDAYALRTPVANGPDDFLPAYLEMARRYDRPARSAYADWLILRRPGDDAFVVFSVDSARISSTWPMMNSVDRRRLLQKSANRKTVEIDDDRARMRFVDLDGLRGWRLSGDCRSFYGADPAVPTAYEGVFLLGRMRETYRFEAFGPASRRAELGALVDTLARSLLVPRAK